MTKKFPGTMLRTTYDAELYLDMFTFCNETGVDVNTLILDSVRSTLQKWKDSKIVGPQQKPSTEKTSVKAKNEELLDGIPIKMCHNTTWGGLSEAQVKFVNDVIKALRKMGYTDDSIPEYFAEKTRDEYFEDYKEWESSGKTVSSKTGKMKVPGKDIWL